MKWFEKCYARLLVDNHITDQDPSFMGRFDPEEYARMAQLGGTESSMVYSCDHNGNCYFPTRVGHMHQGLHGRDIFGETVAALRRRGIVPIAYYTVVYHNHSARACPGSEQVNVLGQIPPSRYKTTCLNCRESLEFYKKELEQVVDYPVEGLFIDMTFWSKFCYCGNCRRKFRERYGAELPEVMDWSDPLWRQFIRFRQESVAEFAAELTKSVRARRPDISVVHQFAGMGAMLSYGQTGMMMQSSDYASGDFYGDREQQRMGVKMFDAYTVNAPYEYMTSRCVNLHDHTSTKSDDELLVHALTTLTSGGAYFFIDAINPDGTLVEAFYRRLGAINRRLAPYRRMIAEHRPRLEADVAVYFSPAMAAEPVLNGTHMKDYGTQKIMDAGIRNSVAEAAGACQALNRLHVPYKVVCENTSELGAYKVIIMTSAADLTETERDRLRRYVQEGGTLIATSRSSLVEDNFALADVFGIDYAGKDSPKVCYISRPDGELVSANRPAPYACPRAGTSVLARLNIPVFPPFDTERYASIHSNPPGKDTEYPAWTEHAFGKGKCIWIATNVFGINCASQQEFCCNMLRRYLPEEHVVVNGDELHQALEVTLLRGADGELLVAAVNYPKEYPVIPLCDITLRLRLPGGKPVGLTRASDGAGEPFSYADGVTEIHLDRLHYGEIWLVAQ